MTMVIGAARIKRIGALRFLGTWMAGFGVATGLAFPFVLRIMQIAPAANAGSLRFRAACLTAGLLVAAVNFSLARLVIGRRLRRLTSQMHRVDEIVRTATSTGQWLALHVATLQMPVEYDDELGEAARAFNGLISALDLSISVRRRLESTLHQQAFYDQLTGLANRALLIDRTEHALSRTRRELTQIAALYIDLDSFKTINDTLGHAAGDEVLIEMARRLTAGRRVTDTVARLGGDEFVVLLEDVDADVAARIAHELCSTLIVPVVLGSDRVVLGASIGVASGGALTHSSDALLRDADIAMYLAKSSGKNCYRVCKPDTRTGSVG